MFIPRILSNASFSIANIGVQICGDEWTATPEYDALVDTEWKKMLIGAKHSIWDGTYYRVLNAAGMEIGLVSGSMQLGIIRYRYIATFPALHAEHSRCHLDPLYHLSTIALIRTLDGHYLFGKRARNGQVDCIGGGVQRDEMVVSCGADIERNLYKEMNEEIGIGNGDVVAILGIGVLLSGTSNVLIVGHVRIGLSKADAASRFDRRTENEMAELAFVPADGLRAFLYSMDDYRNLIPNLLENCV
jgi:hypothetical protein